MHVPILYFENFSNTNLLEPSKDKMILIDQFQEIAHCQQTKMSRDLHSRKNCQHISNRTTVVLRLYD